jgi:myo-inositol-1(or 4)-monophosphatase
MMLKTAIKAAKAAGQIIEDNFQSDTSQSYKNPEHIVTKTDLAAEKAIIDIIQEKYPNHSFFSEEAGAIKKESEYTWVIDPLDGTTNFIHHIKFFSVSIALVHNNSIQLGVVFSPLTNELFTAQANKGSQLNDQTIHVSKLEDINKAVVFLGRNALSEKADHFGSSIFHHTAQKTRTQRILGSAALETCYTACGRFDAQIINNCNFYDAAAGAIIAQEAGAKVTNFSNQPWQPPIDGSQDLLIANPSLHPQFTSFLKDL